MSFAVKSDDLMWFVALHELLELSLFFSPSVCLSVCLVAFYFLRLSVCAVSLFVHLTVGMNQNTQIVEQF